jgi:acyl-CoA hydrolase
MNWQAQLLPKLITSDEAASLVDSHQVIGAGMAAATPVSLLSALGERRGQLEGVRVLSALTIGGNFDFLLDPDAKGRILLESMFYGPNERAGQAIGTATFLPVHGRDFGTRVAANNQFDLFWGTAAPMDAHGHFSLSLSVAFEKEWLEAARRVVLEVNPNLPRTYGDTQVHLRDVDYVVEAERPLIEIPPAAPDEDEEQIGRYVAELIEDGSTIQLGIGGIPNAIARNLLDKRDLGVHTEMFTDGMADLWEAGVVTGKKKTLWNGKMVGAFALGTRKLYDFVHENLAVEFHRGRVTNDPTVIAGNYRMVSVNTALQVDLTGQVASEAIGPHQYSGTGGQLDTALGAQKSPGGKSVIALRSRARGGTISAIVGSLPAGSRVTLPRAETDYVVTEHGIAHLKGRSLRDRARLLIGLAHPDFRQELRDQAQSLGLL